MEIKILCPCGTKFKFDAEPVNGRMPTQVNCPTCGVDATEQANAMLQAMLSAAGPSSCTVTEAAPAAGGLRIKRSSGHAAEVASRPPAAVAPPAPASGGLRSSPTLRKNQPKSRLTGTLTTVLVLGLVAFGAWRFGSKWYKRLHLVATVASAVGEASVDKGESSGPQNLWYEKCAVLFIKHTNHLEVAEACKNFWQTKLHTNLAVLDISREYMEPGEYELIPPHNGYVRIVGAFAWPVPQHEQLAQHLSQTFGTLVFEWRSESFADTYHFGVYDQGIRKFHAQMDIKMAGGEPQEIVTTEGNEFAIANGYKPGPEGFKDFHVLEADKLTQRLGMKLGDEKDGQEIKTMLLKETGPVLNAPPLNRPR